MGAISKYVIFLVIIPLMSVNLFAQNRTESDDFSYALKLYNEQFYDLAAQQFSRFANNYPASERLDEAGYYTGLSMYQLKEFENARIEFQNVAVSFPKSKRAADSWFMVGECYFKLKNEPEAAKSFETVKILYPQQPNAAESAYRAGTLYQKLGETEKAEQLYSLIQDRYLDSPTYMPTLLAHASLFLDKGENSKAREKLSKIIDGNAEKFVTAEALFLNGEIFRKMGLHRDAAAFYQKVISGFEKSPSYPASVLSLAQIQIQQGKYSEAQILLSRAMDSGLPSNNTDQLAEKTGDVHYLNLQYALALKNYESSLSNNKDERYTIRKLKAALAWKGQKNLQKAAEQLQDVVLNNEYFNKPGYAQASEQYFNWLYETKSFDQGISDFYSLKSGSKLSEINHWQFIKFLKSKSNWQAVLRELEGTIQNEGNFPKKDEYLFEMALAYENLKQYDESARLYRKLLVEFPASDIVSIILERLKYLEDNILLDQGFSMNQLAVLIGDLLQNTDRGELQIRLGKIYFENLKDYQSALNQFEQSLSSPENSGKKAELYYYIGLCNASLAGLRESTLDKQRLYLSKAKENLSLAMEQIATAENPDIIADRFVGTGIALDNPPPEKQISYFTTLISKYPSSSLQEKWHKLLAFHETGNDSLLQRAFQQFQYLTQTFPQSKDYSIYLYQLATLKQKLGIGDGRSEFQQIVSSFPDSEPAAKALYHLAHSFEQEAKYSEANILYQKLINDYYYTHAAEAAEESIGDSYLFTGESEKAINYYRQNLASLPPDDVVLNREFASEKQLSIIFKLGRAYAKTGDHSNAQKYLTTYLRQLPEGKYRNEAGLLLGDVYLALKDYESAVTSLEQVGSENTEYYRSALRKIADIKYETSNYEGAASAYTELAKISVSAQDEADIHGRNIIALIRAGKKQQADKLIELYKGKFKNEVNNAAAFQFELGDYYRLNKNFDQALKYFSDVKKNYSKTDYVDDADYYSALTFITLNKQQEALDILTKFPSNYPGSDKLGEVFNTLGGIYFRSEKYESAMISFKSALSKPLSSDLRQRVMSNLIKSYTFVNFWDAALALARDYVADYPHAEDKIDKQITMGQAYVFLGQFDRAVELLKQARLEADSEKEPEIQFYIGDAYLKAGQYENAIAEFVKIPLLSRKTKLQWEASALYYSGQAYEKLGRIDEAVRMYQKIISQAGIDIILKKEAQKRIDQIKG